MTAHIELAARAIRDVRSMDPTNRRRVRDSLDRIAAEDPALNVVALVGHHPWRRARVGDYRVLYRPLTNTERETIDTQAAAGYLIARIIHRSELERAVAALTDS